MWYSILFFFADNPTNQHYYCGLSVTIALKLTTILLQHCINALEACKTTPTQFDSKGLSDRVCITETPGSKVNSSSPDQPPESCDPPIDSMVTSNYSATALLCVDKLSILLPSVRVWLQWVWHQREFWKDWMSEVNKSDMWDYSLFYKNICSSHLADSLNFLCTVVCDPLRPVLIVSSQSLLCPYSAWTSLQYLPIKLHVQVSIPHRLHISLLRVEFWTVTCSCLNLSLSLLPDLPSLTITGITHHHGYLASWYLW